MAQATTTGFVNPVALKAVEQAREVFSRSIGQSLADTKFFDYSSIATAAKTLAAFQPIVAPQIAEALGSSKAFDAAVAATRVSIPTPPPSFMFIKTLDDPKFIEAFRPRVVEMLDVLDVSASFRDAVRSANARTTAVPDFSARLVAAAAETIEVATAGDESGVDPVDDESLGWLDQLSPSSRLSLLLDVGALVVAFIFYAAWLVGDDARDPKGAGFALSCAIQLARVYLRLARKLDDH